MARPRLRLRPLRLLKALVWIVGGAVAAVLALVSAAVLVARTETGRGWVRQLALERARATLPGLDFGRVGGDFVRELSLDDVTVYDGAGRRAIHIDRVAVRFDLWPLLRRTVHVRELDVKQPLVVGRPAPDGGLNLAHLTAPQPAAPPGRGERGAGSAPPSAWRVEIDRVRVYDGVVDIAGAGGAVAEGATDAAAGDRLEISSLTLDGRAAGGARGAWAVISALSARVRAPWGAGQVGAGGRLELAPDAAGALALGPYELALDARDLALPDVAAGAASPATRPSLAIVARGRGIPLAPGSRAEMSVDAPPSTVRGIGIGRLRLRASSDGARWQLARTDVRAAGASLTVAARGAGARFDAELDARVDGGAGHRVRGAVIRGQGHLSLRLRGTLPGHVEVAADLDARQLAAGSLRLGQAALHAKAALERGGPGAPASRARLALRAEGKVAGFAAGGARVQSATLSAALQGRVTSPRGSLHVAARGAEGFGPGGLPRIDAFELDADGDGRALQLRVAARGPRLRAELAAHAQVTARAADVVIDRLALDAETRRGRQTLALAKPATLAYRARDRVEVTGLELRATGPLLAGAATVSGSYALEPGRGRGRGHGPDRDRPLGELTFQLRRAAVAGLDPLDADGRLKVTRERADATLEARLHGGARVSIAADLPVTTPPRGSPRLAAHGPIELRLRADPIRLRDLPFLHRRLAAFGLEGGVLELALAAEGEVARPTVTASVDLRDATVRNTAALTGDGRARSLAGVGLALRVDTRPGTVHGTGDLSLPAGRALHVDASADVDLGAVLAGTSALRADAPLRATAEIPGLDLASLSDFTALLQGARGTLAGRIDVGGTLRSPTGRGDVTVAGAVLGGVPFRKVLVHADAGGGHVAVAANLEQSGGGDLYGEARLDLGGRRTIDARLAAQGLDIAFARSFIPRVRELGGKLRATARATGTLAAPDLRGSLALEGGRLGLIGQPTFRDVTLTASLAPGRLEIERLEMRSGKGNLTARGQVTLEGLEPQSLTLHAQAHEFLVAATGTTGARVDGELAIEAARRQAVIEGKVRVPRALVWLPEVSLGGGRALQPTGRRSDVRFVDPAALAAARREAEAKKAQAAHPVRLDLQAEAGPVQIRSKDIDLDLDSHLHLATRDGEPRLTGSVKVRRGTINVSGQRLEFERGDLVFDGAAEPNPSLDIRLTRQFPEARVVIEIGGTLKKPSLHLRSEPPIYQEAQIVSLLLTGSPGGQPTGGRPFDPTSLVATMVLGKLADAMAPQLGLDVVRVGTVDQTRPTGGGPAPVPLTDTRVEVGKYVSDRVYVSYARVFGASNNTNINEAHLEYRVTRRWIIQTVFGDAGVGSLDALWTYRYLIRFAPA